MNSQPLRVGIGGPVGSGKTALTLALCLALRERYNLAVVTNDIYTREDADFLVRNQRPEWVDAKPKQTAWAIGFSMVLIACFMMGWLGIRNEIVLAWCGVCLSFLFAEAAFGFCAGCWLHMKFSKDKPRLCSGDVCNFDHKEIK